MSTNPNPTGEPKLASIASWAVLGASFGLSATTWIAMAVMAGFTEQATVFGVTLRMAWLMPISVDGYVVVALVLWMSPVPAKVASFAKKNTYFAAGTGIAAQSAYHLLITASVSGEQWRVIMAAVVGALPPTLAGLAIHMRALLRRESALAKKNLENSLAPASPVPPVTPAYIPVPATAVPSAPATVPVAVPMAPALPIRDMAPARPVIAPAPVPVPASGEAASRIAPRHTERARDIVAATGPATRPLHRPASASKTAAALPLDPSSTGSKANATEAVQLALPMLTEKHIAWARELMAEYRAENGTEITPAKLSVKMRIPSPDTAVLIDLLTTETAPVSNVNGRKVTAA